MVKIAPSILSADFGKIGQEVREAVRSGADLVHLDVMDGVYVPNITFGPEVIKCLPRGDDFLYDAHLMISRPENNMQAFLDLDLDRIAIHGDSTTHPHRLLRLIREHDVKPAVCLNPATPLGTIEWILEEVDMVVIMSVNPGFGGQTFIESSLKKVETLKNLIVKTGLPIEIEVDGGITPDNIGSLADAGMDIAVAGSAVFGRADYGAAIETLKRSAGGK